MTRAARRAALGLLTGALIAATAAASTGPAAAQAARTQARPAAHSARRHPAAVTARHRAHRVAVSRHPGAVTARQQSGVRRYWTPWRMRHAVPLRRRRIHDAGPVSWLSAPLTVAPLTATALTATPLTDAPLTVAPRTAARPVAQAQLAAAANGALWSGGGAVARTTGKVFFSLGQHDYVCSASTVASANSAVVVTAAHCVKDGTGSWAANWTFVPGYTNGKDPYGSYTAKRFYVASQWSTAADNNYDVAFVTVNPADVDGSTVSVGREVGGQGIEFGRQPGRELAFGYPSDPPYSGQKLAYCSGKVSPDPYGATADTGLYCPMTAGSSGGPWLTRFDPAAGTGIISSVSSFKYSTSDKILYGPPLGAAAQALYKAAEHG